MTGYKWSSKGKKGKLPGAKQARLRKITKNVADVLITK